MRRGTSLIDLVMSIAILSSLFGGVYLVYFAILGSVANINLRTAASSAIANEIETIRNLPYDSVGTVGGIPSGVVPEFQTIAFGNYSFAMQTIVRDIDDPFDGTLGGTPNDSAPADYKLISIEATCPTCDRAFDELITTTVAPKNLESASTQGSLSLKVIDASGIGVANATIHLVNASVTPSIDLVDTTNASGVLLLVGAPTSTQRYSVAVSKSGYSSDQTYLPGAAGNPNPSEPHLTAVAQTVTPATFAIDRVSQLTVTSVTNRCVPVANESFTIKSSKLIGTTPDVYKFSTSSSMNASGTATLSNLEWGTYFIGLSDATKNVMGTIPLDPFAINPSTTAMFQFVVSPAANPSLLVSAVDSASGAGIMNATTTLSGGGNTYTLVTGHAQLSDTDWSAGQYTSQSGTDTSVAGKVTMMADASGTYTTSTTAWIISNTFDVGGTSSTFYAITWKPSGQPVAAGANSLKLQVATNNDNATWNFIGPDGTGGTYFTTSSTLPAALNSNRYVRYKAYLSTQDGNTTPELDSVTIDFSANCVPPAQVLFTGLSAGSYTLDVLAPSYSENSSTVSIGAGFQSSTVVLLP
jgi:hypothetical protein